MRVNKSHELLCIESRHMTHPWHDIVALDEVRFESPSNYDLMWMASGKIVPDRGRPTI